MISIFFVKVNLELKEIKLNTEKIERKKKNSYSQTKTSN